MPSILYFGIFSFLKKNALRLFNTLSELIPIPSTKKTLYKRCQFGFSYPFLISRKRNDDRSWHFESNYFGSNTFFNNIANIYEYK